MAALSSTIRMRRLASGERLAMGSVRRVADTRENERCATAGSIAPLEQRAAEFLSGERPAVQAETVSGRAGREAMGEKAGHVLRGNADAIVDDANSHADRRGLDAQGEKLVGPARLIAGVF